MENPVLVSNKYVLKNSKNVFIDFEKIKLLSFRLRKFRRPSFPLDLHFLINFEKTLNFLLIVDCLNFCFWNKKKKWKVKTNKKYEGGYRGMIKSLKYFFRENPKYLDFKKLSEISYLKFKEMFRGGKNLLLLKERWRILKEVSFVISRKYKNSFFNFIKNEKRDALYLLMKIGKELPFFKDERKFKGRRIFFYKRAQHLISNIFGLEKSFHLKTFENINKLTAFSDYKLPQVLYHFKVLRYSKKLKEKIKNRQIIKKGSNFEIEIRGNTIFGIEFLKEEFQKLGSNFYSFEIDWILWNLTQRMRLNFHHHLTKTIDY